MPQFISGLALSEAFYREVVRPIFEQHFPGLAHSAALIGFGSDVLGFDDVRATDHYWGPRCYLFLTEADRAQHAEEIERVFGAQLPDTFRGYATNFEGEHASDVRRMKPRRSGPVQHLVYVESIENYFGWYLGCAPFAELSCIDWLTCSEHKLLAVTSGQVFHDGLGTLTAARRKLSYYPRDIWLCLLAAQWLKLSEEEAFVGRCGETGDELGSALIAARQVKNLMRLCFLQERRYAPYSKWLGAGFAQLDCAAELSNIFRKVLLSETWTTRETHLAAAYEFVAQRHNALQLTPPLAPETGDYYDRPFRVLRMDRFAAALRAAIGDERLRAAPFSKGSVNQWVDSDERLSNVSFCQQLRAAYA